MPPTQRLLALDLDPRLCIIIAVVAVVAAVVVVVPSDAPITTHFGLENWEARLVREQNV